MSNLFDDEDEQQEYKPQEQAAAETPATESTTAAESQADPANPYAQAEAQPAQHQLFDADDNGEEEEYKP